MISDDIPGHDAIPESVRIAQRACANAWVLTPSQPSCAALASTQKIQVPVSGSTLVVTVETVPASVTLRQTVTQLKKNESDPYDPVTRFARYFPPAPLPYVCPERLPSNDPLPRESPCVPITRFQGSAPGR